MHAKTIGKSEGKSSLGRFKGRWENNFKTDITKIEHEDVN
jgi:hypothetical protein